MRNGAWDHPDTARYYEAFCRRHDRYRNAARALADHACIDAGQHILDLAAGTGRSAEQILLRLGPQGEVLCVEPAGTMRQVGMARLPDPRVTWSAALTEEAAGFDRVVCSAAIWLLEPMDDVFHRVYRVLKPGGAFAFNIPSAYLGEPDEPGGGCDPHLARLAELLAARRTSLPPPAGVAPPTAIRIGEMLEETGFHPESWHVRTRLGYRAYRDWLKIPVVTEAIFAGLPADQRAELIDQAFDEVDSRSWRWEGWRGWTAWKRP